MPDRENSSIGSGNNENIKTGYEPDIQKSSIPDFQYTPPPPPPPSNTERSQGASSGSVEES